MYNRCFMFKQDTGISQLHSLCMYVEGEGEETSNLRARYAASHLGQSNGKRTQELLQQYKSKQETKTKTSYKYATNILWQVSICTSSRV